MLSSQANSYLINEFLAEDVFGIIFIFLHIDYLYAKIFFSDNKKRVVQDRRASRFPNSIL